MSNNKFNSYDRTPAQIVADEESDLDTTLGVLIGELGGLQCAAIPMETIAQFVAYFRNTWMSKKNMWNLFNVADGHRTNNDFEGTISNFKSIQRSCHLLTLLLCLCPGWHNHMNINLKAKDNIWSFIKSLKTEQISKNIEVLQIRAGTDIVPMRAQHRRKETSLANLRNQYLSNQLSSYQYINSLSLL